MPRRQFSPSENDPISARFVKVYEQRRDFRQLMLDAGFPQNQIDDIYKTLPTNGLGEICTKRGNEYLVDVDRLIAWLDHYLAQS